MGSTAESRALTPRVTRQKIKPRPNAISANVTYCNAPPRAPGVVGLTPQSGRLTELPRHSEMSRLVLRNSLSIEVAVTAVSVVTPESGGPTASAGAGASTARTVRVSRNHRRMDPSSRVMGVFAQRGLDSGS